MSTAEHPNNNREITLRFLQTAVVIDDEAYMGLKTGEELKNGITQPNRNTQSFHQDEQNLVVRSTDLTLNANSIIESFAQLGIICAVVGPIDSSIQTMKQADIVVLDWRLQKNQPEHALRLLRDLLCDDTDQNSLRLVAIYTGEQTLDHIVDKVFEQLKKSGLKPEKRDHAEISYRHGRVVLYAKPNVNLSPPFRERSVDEENLPERLVNDFASMTEGLLPGIALTSLTAVREGAHKVLDRFSSVLDPAFLTHRSCLTDPEDAERQMVNHLAEELRGLMDNAVAEKSPAGEEAVKGWIIRKGHETQHFRFDDKTLSLEQTIDLANNGLRASSFLRDKHFEFLSSGFADLDSSGLDEQLAWIMSFRTVYNAPPPTLWLGSVISAQDMDDERHLICMRPRCDSVRLKKETVFLFLPLVDPKRGMDQIVVRFDEGFKRLGIERDQAGWILCRFKPSSVTGAVTAVKRGSDPSFKFTDGGGTLYTWRGELKAEYAQRIAQNFATTLSRVAVDESEWLRRMARKG